MPVVRSPGNTLTLSNRALPIPPVEVHGVACVSQGLTLDNKMTYPRLEADCLQRCIFPDHIDLVQVTSFFAAGPSTLPAGKLIFMHAQDGCVEPGRPGCIATQLVYTAKPIRRWLQAAWSVAVQASRVAMTLTARFSVREQLLDGTAHAWTNVQAPPSLAFPCPIPRD